MSTHEDNTSGARALYPWQVEGVAWLRDRTAAVLADEPGLGKTATVLRAAAAGRPVVVVAPASLLRNWGRELELWRPDLTGLALSGDAFRWPAPGECMLVSHDNIPGARGTPSERARVRRRLKRQAPDGTALIVDESHAFKSGRSRRTTALRGLSRRVLEAPQGSFWQMTGTPVLNHPAEFWTLLCNFQRYDGNLASELYGSREHFTRQFGGVIDGLGNVLWGTPKPEAMDLVRPYFLRRTKADMLGELPPKRYHSVPVAATIEDQIVSPTARRELAAEKIDELHTLLDELDTADPTTPLVVFSAHLAPLTTACMRRGWKAITGEQTASQRQRVVEQFQASKLRGVACSIQAAGVGLTLTRAHRVVFVDLHWVPALNTQAEDRVHRIGQTRQVDIFLLESTSPIDDAVRRVVRRKANLYQKTTEAL